jgi:hypothetical protein
MPAMRYPRDLPTADRQELSAAMASDDPVAFIDQHIAAINGIENWAVAESAKWQRAKVAVEMFGTTAGGADGSVELGDAETQVETRPSHASLNGGERPKTRRAALLILFREAPDREWRTRELADELGRRGWAGPSGNEANKVSRSLAVMVAAGEIDNVRKGRYKLRTPPGARPQPSEPPYDVA